MRSGVTAAIREQVLERDQGICQWCGIEVGELERQGWGGRGPCLPGKLTSAYWAPRGRQREQRSRLIAEVNLMVAELAEVVRSISGVADRQLRRAGFDTGISLWQADHVVPVSEGGGGCDLSGYRLLCVPCHKGVTAALAARTAAIRRAPDPQLKIPW